MDENGSDAGPHLSACRCSDPHHLRRAEILGTLGLSAGRLTVPNNRPMIDY